MLSKKAQYSVLALVCLAKAYQKGPLLIRDISKSEQIPRKFLETILLELRKQGILGSKKGKGGGYFLIKDPKEVNLADIIRHFDGAIALMPCVTYKYYQPCLHGKDEPTCGIRSIIKDVRDEMVRILKNTTLSDILAREEQLENSSINFIK